MIGVDTNVVVRLLVADDAPQAKAAAQLFSALTPAEPAWLSQVVLVETYWVLRRAYDVPHDATVAALRRLVGASDLVIEMRESVEAALEAAERGADFADALIALGARRAGARTTMTFDARAARSLDAMQLLQA